MTRRGEKVLRRRARFARVACGLGALVCIGLAAAVASLPAVVLADSRSEASPAGTPAATGGDDSQYFAHITSIDDFVRISDLDRTGYANIDKPMKLDRDYHVLTPRTGGAVVEVPGGIRLRMDPGSEISWINEVVVLNRGFFEIEAPTLAYFRYIPEDSELGSARGTARITNIVKTLDSCQQYFQAIRRSRFQIMIKPGRAPQMQVMDGDVHMGRALLLPPRKAEDLNGLPKDLRPPAPMIPFIGHTFHLPMDEMAFVVESLPGRAWIFDFSENEEFAEIFCRILSPKNTVNIPPFPRGEYFWRVSRVNEEGIRTLFSEPSDFMIE